jgi:tetratricopeptide (TPR) repeat protein
MQVLDINIRNKIDTILIESYKELQAKNCETAIQLAIKAWEEIPEPKFGWDVSKSFTLGIAETYRDCKIYPPAIKFLEDLFSSNTVKEYQDGPYFMMGTTYYEMGDNNNALKWLTQANAISKGRCFREEDPKYLKFFLENKKDK